MGQITSKDHTIGKEQSKDVPLELSDLIPELKDVTLKGVVPFGDSELGRGAYGCVFTVKCNGVN